MSTDDHPGEPVEPAGAEQSTGTRHTEEGFPAERGGPRPVLLVALVVLTLLLGGLGYLGLRTLQDRGAAAGTIVGTAGVEPSDDVPGSADAAESSDSPETPPAQNPGGTTEGDLGGDGRGLPAAPPAQSAADGPAGGATAGSPAGSTARTVDAYDVKLGDCLGDPGSNPTVQTLVVLACSEPHHSEAYASFDLPDGAYPGDGQVEADAMQKCEARFAEFIGRPRARSTLEFAFLTPTESTWSRNDRAVMCIVYHPSQATTGSLQGSAR